MSELSVYFRCPIQCFFFFFFDTKTDFLVTSCRDFLLLTESAMPSMGTSGGEFLLHQYTYKKSPGGLLISNSVCEP